MVCVGMCVCVCTRARVHKFLNSCGPVRCAVTLQSPVLGKSFPVLVPVPEKGKVFFRIVSTLALASSMKSRMCCAVATMWLFE